MAIYLGNTLLTGPSGGTGDAVLADDQTFTGINTFNNAAGIQVENIVGATDMHITANGQEFITYDDSLGVDILQINSEFATALAVGGNSLMSFGSSTGVRVNPSFLDTDFLIQKQTSGNALSYDAGTDTLTTEAANLVGFAGAETGTWTPSFTGGGTQGTTTATYSKTGSTVIAQASVFIAPGTIPQPFALSPSSLPFSDNSPSNAAIGTYFVAATNNSLSQSNSGVVASGTATSIVFLDNVREDELAGTEIRGYIGFTLTYQTND